MFVDSGAALSSGLVPKSHSTSHRTGTEERRRRGRCNHGLVEYLYIQVGKVCACICQVCIYIVHCTCIYMYNVYVRVCSINFEKKMYSVNFHVAKVFKIIRYWVHIYEIKISQNVHYITCTCGAHTCMHACMKSFLNSRKLTDTCTCTLYVEYTCTCMYIYTSLYHIHVLVCPCHYCV